MNPSDSVRPNARVIWQPNKNYYYPESVRMDEYVSLPDANVRYSIWDFSH
jgi:hypothetical protein